MSSWADSDPEDRRDIGISFLLVVGQLIYYDRWKYRIWMFELRKIEKYEFLNEVF